VACVSHKEFIGYMGQQGVDFSMHAGMQRHTDFQQADFEPIIRVFVWKEVNSGKGEQEPRMALT